MSAASTGRAALVQLGATLVEDPQGNVTEVNLGHRKVNDSALIHLVKLPKLQKLYLESTQVTDAGMRHLFELHELRLINLGDTLVTVDGRRELRNKLPEASVFPLDLATPLSTTVDPLNPSVEDHEAVPQEVAQQVPSVYLTEGHKALCRVMVGDKMPVLTLKALDGSEDSLADHYGKTLTVVFFWTPNRFQARELLVDMDLDMVRPFASRGVGVVGVAVGGESQETLRLLSELNVTYPNLFDRDQSGFAKVGSQRLPRVYLLDSKGEILWFDIEYSLSTRRELLESILFLLGDK